MPNPSNAAEVLTQIQEARARNNVNWMDLSRLAFEVAPERAKEIFARITSEDEKILGLSKQIAK